MVTLTTIMSSMDTELMSYIVVGMFFFFIVMPLLIKECGETYLESVVKGVAFIFFIVIVFGLFIAIYQAFGLITN